MPNDRSANMICPYYMTEEQCRIYCEGAIEDYTRVDTVFRFRNQYMKENHISKYCASYNYEKCAYAKYLDKKL